TTAASAASGRVQFRQVPGCDGGAGTSTTAAGPAGPGGAGNGPSTGTGAAANVSRVATASIVSAPTSTPYTIRRYGIVARSGVLGAGGAGRGARGVRSMTTVILPGSLAGDAREGGVSRPSVAVVLRAHPRRAVIGRTVRFGCFTSGGGTCPGTSGTTNGRRRHRRAACASKTRPAAPESPRSPSARPVSRPNVANGRPRSRPRPTPS